MQGVQCKADFLVMAIGGCEAVLGVQWLTTLGRIVWNFTDMTMSFKLDGKECCLQGITKPDVQLISSHACSRFFPMSMLLLGPKSGE